MLYTLIPLHSRSSRQVICQETRDSQWSEQPWSSSIFSAAAAKVSMHWEGFVGTGMARNGPFESRYTCTHAPSIEDWKSTQHEWLSPFNFQCFNVADLQVQVEASWNWVPTWPNWRIIYDFALCYLRSPHPMSQFSNWLIQDWNAFSYQSVSPGPQRFLCNGTLHELFVRQLGQMMQAALPNSLEQRVGLTQRKTVHLLHQRPWIWDHEM